MAFVSVRVRLKYSVFDANISHCGSKNTRQAQLLLKHSLAAPVNEEKGAYEKFLQSEFSCELTKFRPAEFIGK